MKEGDITEFGEVVLVSYDKCFVQFCDIGGGGIHGCFSMTFEEIEKAQDNNKREPCQP